jgi:hypothetical protein
LETSAESEAAAVAALFTRSDGRFRFARWDRPLVPVITGTDEEGARIFEHALGAVAGLGGLPIAGTDPELGANFLVFFCSSWTELPAIPGLARLVPDLDRLLSVLQGAGANQYRIFGFDDAGAIRICLVLLRYDDDLKRVSARTLALSQSVQSLLLWSDGAFTAESPLALLAPEGRAVVKPWHADLVRAAYDRALPAASDEPGLALRLQARMALLRDQRAESGA